MNELTLGQSLLMDKLKLSYPMVKGLNINLAIRSVFNLLWFLRCILFTSVFFYAGRVLKNERAVAVLVSKEKYFIVCNKFVASDVME